MGYRARLKNFSASQGRGTALAIDTLVVGLRDEVSNSEVMFAQVIEPVAPGLSQLYITDGSASFALDQQVFDGEDVVISDAVTGDRRGRLHQFAPFKKQSDPLQYRTPRVFASVNRGASTSVGGDYLEDTSQNMITDAFKGMWLKLADDQFAEITGNSAIRFNISFGGGTPAFGSYAVLDLESVDALAGTGNTTSVGPDALADTTQSMTTNAYAGYVLLDAAYNLWPIVSNTGTAFVLDAGGATPAAGMFEVYYSNRSLPLVLGEDFNFNESTGHLELADPLVEHDAVVASSKGSLPGVGAYTYTIGLGALVQRAVNGDPTDFDDFPGIKSTGTQVLVSAPTIVSPTFAISILPANGVSVSSLLDPVSTIVQAYVNSLGIGERVILTELIKRVKSYPGVADLTIISPTSNVPVGDGQLARVGAAEVEIF